MEDVSISKFRAQVVRAGSTPASPGFVVSEGQNPVDPSGSGQNHLPVTIGSPANGLAVTDAQVLTINKAQIFAGTASQFVKGDGTLDSTTYGTGTVTSVALTMPSAFSVGGSPITTAGTLAVTGAGTVGQYIRGDGSLATFPATTGGGSSVTYYLNGSVSQGTIGGVAYREVNRTPIFGAGTDISIGSNGYIANFITDAGDPNKLLIPAGNWNLETYFSANNGGGSPTFYVELYKYNGTTFTLIATSSGTPELIAFGTNINPYFTTLAVPETVLALTDRLALRYYVNTSGRTITLHTENGHLCQVITTFTTGLTALNGLTNQVQFFAVGTSGTDFAISSATDTHTFNLPTASATNRGALSSADWTTFNSKVSSQWITNGSDIYYSAGNVGINRIPTSSFKLDIQGSTGIRILDNDVLRSIIITPPVSGVKGVISTASGEGISLQATNASGFVTIDTAGLERLKIDSIGTSTFTRSGKSILLNPNVSALNVDSEIELTSGMNLFFKLGGAERFRISSDGDLTAGNAISNEFIFKNNGNFAGGSGAETIFSLVYGGQTIAQIRNTGTDQRDAIFTLRDENSIKVSISANNSRGGSTYFNGGGNVLIGKDVDDSSGRLQVSGTVGVTSSVTANSFIKIGGTSSQFLKADGSVDSTTYVPTSRTITINGTSQDLSADRTFNVGTVTSVTASTPLFSSGGNTPNITIQQASGSQSGFLSSTDWTTFNSKVSSQWITNGSDIYYSAGNIGILTLNPNGRLAIRTQQSNTPSLLFQNELGGPSSAISNYESAAQTFTALGTNIYINNAAGFSRFDATKASSAIVFDEGTLYLATGSTAATASSRMSISPTGAATFTNNVTAKSTGSYTGFLADNSSSAAVGGGYFAIQSFGVTRGIFGVAGAISGTTDNNVGIFAEGGSGNGAIKFMLNGSATPSHTMTSGGNFLIGTTSDNSNRLRVQGQIFINANTQLDSQTTTGVGSSAVTIANFSGAEGSTYFITAVNGANYYRAIVNQVQTSVTIVNSIYVGTVGSVSISTSSNILTMAISSGTWTIKCTQIRTV